MEYSRYIFDTFGRVEEGQKPRFVTMQEIAINESGNAINENGDAIKSSDEREPIAIEQGERKTTFLSIVDMSKISLVSTTEYFDDGKGQQAEISGFCLIQNQMNLFPVNQYSADGSNNVFFFDDKEYSFLDFYEFISTLIS
jgi:hypothetical protein